MREEPIVSVTNTIDNITQTVRVYVGTYRWYITAISLLILFVIPLIFPPYQTRVAAFSLFAIILAGSFNLISGFTGYISFGQGAFIGIGAYAGTLLMSTAGIPLLASVFVAGVLSALIAGILGYPLLRLRGHYFAITTFIIQLSLAAFVSSVDSLGGGRGLVARSVWSYDYYYYAFAVITVLTVATTYLVRKSYFGLRLLAINSNEVQAETLGVPTHRYKLQAFILSAIFPGMAGAVWANYVGYISPDSAFNPHLSVEAVLYTLTGGLGTVLGPVIGALSLSLVNNSLGTRFPEFDRVMFGLLIVVVILYMPRGILGLFNEFE